MDGSGPRGTDQVPAGRITVSKDESGPRRMNLGPAGRIRASQDDDEPNKPKAINNMHFVYVLKRSGDLPQYVDFAKAASETAKLEASW